MKKVSLVIIHDVLTSGDNGSYSNEEIDAAIADLEAELNRGATEKANRAAAYEKIHSLIVDNLTDQPVTCADLYEEIQPEVLSQGMSHGNVQYALNNLWQDEIEKIPGKPNTYKRRD